MARCRPAASKSSWLVGSCGWAAGSLLGTFFCDDLAALGLGYRQKAKIRAICGTAAKTHFADTDITRDEAVKAKCLDEIRRDVLTQAQRDRHGRATPPR